MYSIHYKLYGMELTDTLKSIIVKYFDEICPDCTTDCDPNIICNKCSLIHDGDTILADIYDIFWTTYSGGEDAPIILGVDIDSCEEFNSKYFPKFYRDETVPDKFLLEYKTKYELLPIELRTVIEDAGLKPGIVFALGTS